MDMTTYYQIQILGGASEGSVRWLTVKNAFLDIEEAKLTAGDLKGITRIVRVSVEVV